MVSRRYGFLGVIATLLLVLLAGGIGYALGVGANGAPGVHYGYWPAWGFGFGFFGLLFPILFFVLIFSAIRGWGRGWDGHDGGRWGRGYYGRPWQGDVPPAVAEWHRHLHEADTAPNREGQPSTGGQGGYGSASSGTTGSGGTGSGPTASGNTGSDRTTF